MEKCWLKERRDLFLKNVVKDFFDSYAFFIDLKEHTSKYGIRYDGLDFWVGTEQNKGKLWQLKDLCHLLWGESDPVKEDHGFMLDWMIGAIFHEAMKLKENAYMIERYRSSYPLKDKALLRPNHNGGAISRGFFEETDYEIQRGIKRIDHLFGHAEMYLTKVLQKEEENALLVRFLLEAVSEPEEQWPESSGPNVLLKALFPKGLDEAYCLAGESYLEGSWFLEARLAFEKALELNPDCSEGRSGLRLLEKLIKELAIMLEREYEIQMKNGNQEEFIK